MASAQCNRPANETCQQKCQGSSSLGQKMSNWIKGSSHNGQQSKPIYQTQAQVQTQAQAQAQAHAQAKAHSCPNQGPSKAQTHQACHVAAKPLQPQCGVNKASGHDHHTVYTHSHGHGHGHSHTKHQTTIGTACNCANKTSGNHSHGHNHPTSGGVSCYGRTRVRCEHKEGNLVRRIKDRISRKNHCNDSGTSSSDSESDNECCHKRKN